MGVCEGVVEEVCELVVFEAPTRSYEQIVRRLRDEAFDGDVATQALDYCAAKVNILVNGEQVHVKFAGFKIGGEASVSHNLQLMEFHCVDG